MLVLGLDPSLRSFGWALHDTEASGRARCPARGRLKTGSDDLYIDRYISHRESVFSLIQDLCPDKIALEYPIFGDFYSEGLYGLFLYCSEAIKLARKDVVFFANTQTKALAKRTLNRPKGWKIGKPDMIESAKLDTGGGRWSSDEADAYMAALLGSRFWGLKEGLVQESGLSPFEFRMFSEISEYVRGKKKGKLKHKGMVHREGERYFLWSKLDCGDING